MWYFRQKKKIFRKEVLDGLMLMFIFFSAFKLGSMKRLSNWRSWLTFRSGIHLSGEAGGIKE